MRDFFDQPISVGDTVAFIENGYRNLKRGTIVATTPQKVRVRFLRLSGRGYTSDETLRFPIEVMKKCNAPKAGEA